MGGARVGAEDLGGWVKAGVKGRRSSSRCTSPTPGQENLQLPPPGPRSSVATSRRLPTDLRAQSDRDVDAGGKFKPMREPVSASPSIPQPLSAALSRLCKYLAVPLPISRGGSTGRLPSHVGARGGRKRHPVDVGKRRGVLAPPGGSPRPSAEPRSCRAQRPNSAPQILLGAGD